MVKPLLFAVVIITNGKSNLFVDNADAWIAEGFVPGITLFFCGPMESLIKQGVAVDSIIDYTDPPYYLNNFHINHKKYLACESVNASYIYLVHDRFFPQKGLLEKLTNVLEKNQYDFGALDVNNLDGSPALRELRLKKHTTINKLESALEPLGRLVCAKTCPQASDSIAINGGQFFIRKNLSHHLKRPLRWVEMEDDILSHDLLYQRGYWVSECRLVTVVPRISSSTGYNRITRLKYFCYIALCNLLAKISGSLSVGYRVDSETLTYLTSREVLLIDPFHKITSSDFLPSSLEKIMARARVLSDGKAWSRINRHPLGWKLIGFD
jgi:hypothetical protein